MSPNSNPLGRIAAATRPALLDRRLRALVATALLAGLLLGAGEAAAIPRGGS